MGIWPLREVWGEQLRRSALLPGHTPALIGAQLFDQSVLVDGDSRFEVRYKRLRELLHCEHRRLRDGRVEVVVLYMNATYIAVPVEGACEGIDSDVVESLVRDAVPNEACP